MTPAEEDFVKKTKQHLESIPIPRRFLYDGTGFARIEWRAARAKKSKLPA